METDGTAEVLGVTKEGVTVIGPVSRTLLAEPTKVGPCAWKLGVACDCTVGSVSSGVAAKNIISTESIVVDPVIFLKIFIGLIHPIFAYSVRIKYNTLPKYNFWNTI